MRRRQFLRTLAAAVLATPIAEQLGAVAAPKLKINPAWVEAPYEVQVLTCDVPFVSLSDIMAAESGRLAGNITRAMVQKRPFPYPTEHGYTIEYRGLKFEECDPVRMVPEVSRQTLVDVARAMNSVKPEL